MKNLMLLLLVVVFSASCQLRSPDNQFGDPRIAVYVGWSKEGKEVAERYCEKRGSAGAECWASGSGPAKFIKKCTWPEFLEAKVEVEKFLVEMEREKASQTAVEVMEREKFQKLMNDGHFPVQRVEAVDDRIASAALNGDLNGELHGKLGKGMGFGLFLLGTGIAAGYNGGGEFTGDLSGQINGSADSRTHHFLSFAWKHPATGLFYSSVILKSVVAFDLNAGKEAVSFRLVDDGYECVDATARKQFNEEPLRYLEQCVKSVVLHLPPGEKYASLL